MSSRAYQQNSLGCFSWQSFIGFCVLYFLIRGCGGSPTYTPSRQEVYNVAVSLAQQEFRSPSGKYTNPNWNIITNQITPLPMAAYPAPMEVADVFPAPTESNSWKVRSYFLVRDTAGSIVADWSVYLDYDSENKRWKIGYFQGCPRLPNGSPTCSP